MYMYIYLCHIMALDRSYICKWTKGYTCISSDARPGVTLCVNNKELIIVYKLYKFREHCIPHWRIPFWC